MNATFSGYIFTSKAGGTFNGFPTAPSAGIGGQAAGNIISILNPLFLTYDLQTSLGPITGPDNFAGFLPGTPGHVAISLGSFSNVTFQATIAPEPTTLGLVTLPLAAFAIRRRHRLAKIARA